MMATDTTLFPTDSGECDCGTEAVLYDASHVWPGLDPLCEACARGMINECPSCDTGTSDADWQWTPDLPVPDAQECDHCAARSRKADEFASLQRDAEALVERMGWRVTGQDQAQTGSEYWTLEHSAPDDDHYPAEITLRVSDHGDCYCSTDYSLVVERNATPGDISMADLERILAAPKFEAVE